MIDADRVLHDLFRLVWRRGKVPRVELSLDLRGHDSYIHSDDDWSVVFLRHISPEASKK
jgi:hypothetical protein